MMIPSNYHPRYKQVNGAIKPMLRLASTLLSCSGKSGVQAATDKSWHSRHGPCTWHPSLSPGGVIVGHVEYPVESMGLDPVP